MDDYTSFQTAPLVPKKLPGKFAEEGQLWADTENGYLANNTINYISSYSFYYEYVICI